MNMKLATALILALFLVFLVFTAGCDRLIIITGTVYEWVNAPDNAQSWIYHKEYTARGLLKEDVPQEMELHPIRGALINYSAVLRYLMTGVIFALQSLWYKILDNFPRLCMSQEMNINP